MVVEIESNFSVVDAQSGTVVVDIQSDGIERNAQSEGIVVVNVETECIVGDSQSEGIVDEHAFVFCHLLALVLNGYFHHFVVTVSKTTSQKTCRIHFCLQMLVVSVSCYFGWFHLFVAIEFDLIFQMILISVDLYYLMRLLDADGNVATVYLMT